MKTVSKHIITGTALALFAAASFHGCSDFLTSAAAPQGTLNDETLANEAGVEGSLVAAYRALDWNLGVGGAWGNAASNWVWGSVTSDEAYKGSEASDQPPINDIEGYHWSTGDAESYLNDKWRGVYEGVVRSNAVIRLLDQVVAADPNEIAAATAASIEGEALFLRAHFHFEAWRMWGRIPYYREDDTDFRKANMDATAAITEVLADLDAAIALLPTTPRNPGRVSQWTAKAYKGRVQMYAGDFAGALTTLNDVRNNGPFALEASYDRVWSALVTNGPETILAYQASANDGEPEGNNGNWGERLNFPHGTSPFTCCGFHQPSQNLVNFFQVDGAGLPLALSSGTWNASSANFAAGTPGAVDPRLDWTVGRDNVPYKDWGVHEAAWIRSPTFGGRYSPKKNAYEDASNARQAAGGWAPTQMNSMNMHIFRYADMLLLLAEAEIEVGSLENARTIINQVRTRAGQLAQGCGVPASASAAATLTALYPQCAGDSRIAVPLNDPSITWATYSIGTYNTPFPDQATARTIVRYERKLELGMEGQRFFDLKRWGVAESVLNAYLDGVGGGSERGRTPNTANAEAFTSRHLMYPIPAIQIELSKVGTEMRLTQNPGW